MSKVFTLDITSLDISKADFSPLMKLCIHEISTMALLISSLNNAPEITSRPKDDFKFYMGLLENVLNRTRPQAIQSAFFIKNFTVGLINKCIEVTKIIGNFTEFFEESKEVEDRFLAAISLRHLKVLQDENNFFDQLEKDNTTSLVKYAYSKFVTEELNPSEKVKEAIKAWSNNCEDEVVELEQILNITASKQLEKIKILAEIVFNTSKTFGERFVAAVLVNDGLTKIANAYDPRAEKAANSSRKGK